MATKREAKKKIKTEYRKLREDIENYLAKGTEAGKKKAQKLLDKVNKAEEGLVNDINNSADTTKKYFKDLFSRAVDQIDKEYNELKDLISK